MMPSEDSLWESVLPSPKSPEAYPMVRVGVKYLNYASTEVQGLTIFR